MCIAPENPEQNQEDEVTLLRKERDYYKRYMDELAGEAIKRDYTISTLRHALQQKRQGFALLSELQQYIGSKQMLQEIFDHTVQHINATLGMDKSVLLTPGNLPHHYTPSVWMGFDVEIFQELKTLQLEIIYKEIPGNHSLLVNAATEPTPLIRKIQEAFDLPYFILIPILVSDEPIGLLLTGRQRELRPFVQPLIEDDVDTLQAVSVLIGAFIHNRQLVALREDNEMLRYLATIDALTDIPNRWRFEGMLQQEWVLANRSGAPLSLLLLDVDHFKQCNDTYGHDVGDAILKQVAQRITKETRPKDLCARYGGEEFVVILPDTEIGDAMKVAERIRRQIETTPMDHQVDNTQSKMTISIGVASLHPTQDQEPTQLITLADKALYQAKRNGRNQVVQAETA